MQLGEVAQPTGLNVTVVNEKAGKFLEFKANNSSTERIELTERITDNLDALIKALPDSLHQVHQAMCVERNTDGFWNNLDASLRTVEQIGNDFIFALVNASGVKRLFDVFAAAFRFAEGRQEPVAINFVVDEADKDFLSFPLDLLPIMSPYSESIEGPEQLERFVLRFPAFGASVTRRIAKPFDGRSAIQNCASGRVPIKIIRNESFYSAHAEPETLSDALWLAKQPRLLAEELWPNTDIQTRPAAKLLGRSLLDPRYAFNDEHRSFADQIQHFTCHFTQNSKGLGVLGLRQAYGQINALDIDLSMLGTALLDASKVAPSFPSDVVGPLIFLNACGSGSIDPKGRISLIEALLDWSPARAIVATQTPVDYPLAARFARLVYQNMLDGDVLGRAIHRARWAFIDSEQLPFGLFYLLYGNAVLRFLD
jgi:hypothetical protein